MKPNLTVCSYCPFFSKGHSGHSGVLYYYCNNEEIAWDYFDSLYPQYEDIPHTCIMPEEHAVKGGRALKVFEAQGAKKLKSILEN